MAEESALFVHGTGVRSARLEILFGEVKSSVAEHCPHLKPKACYWGDLGVPSGLIPKSLPSTLRDETRLASRFQEEEMERIASEWRLLYLDPFIEVRPLGGETAIAPIAGQQTPGQAFQSMLVSKKPNDRLLAAIESLGFSGAEDAWHLALETLQNSKEFSGRKGATHTMTDPGVSHRRAVSRALVALLVISAGEHGYSACDGECRTELLREVEEHLGATVLGIGRAAKSLSWPLRRASEWWLHAHRGTLSASGIDFLGDILVYQTRGAAIRERIRASLGDAATVVAHSLGGVAIVDLLVESLQTTGDDLGVKRLVTIGSQAPYLYEIGALASLEPGQRLPNQFPAWLNIYDRSDLLSFRAGTVFNHDGPPTSERSDYEVDTGQPFPESHSAYFRHQPVWQRIMEFTS